jgi:hypothetical protein
MKMAAAPASERLEFGPRRAPIWMARIFGAIACAGSLLVLVAAGITLRTTGQAQAIFGVLGLFCAIWIAFGVWMLITASRMSRFRAIVTPGALRLVAAKGRSVWFQGSVAEITTPWTDVQGFSRVDTPNPAARGGAQSTYILFTKGGDFSLNSIQWENLDGLIAEIARRSGHSAGEVAPERAAAEAQLQVSERRMSSVQRVFGWIILVASGAMLLPVIVGMLARGPSVDLARAALFLIFAMGVAASMIRFYRRR